MKSVVLFAVFALLLAGCSKRPTGWGCAHPMHIDKAAVIAANAAQSSFAGTAEFAVIADEKSAHEVYKGEKITQCEAKAVLIRTISKVQSVSKIDVTLKYTLDYSEFDTGKVVSATVGE